jgi:hypothetical protein
MKEHHEYRGYTIVIEPDPEPMSPDEFGDSSLFLTATHWNFFVEREGFNHGRDLDMVETLERFHVLPLFAYIHSGVALSLNREAYPFNCPWDACQVGWVFASKEEFSSSETARIAAEGLIEMWNTSLSGDVWGFEVLEEDSEEPVNSCWGIFSSEYALAAAKEAVDSIIEGT